MAIEYTDKLNLPLVPDGYGEEPGESWGPGMRDAMGTLDDNPGIIAVDGEVAMLALETWDGRIVRRTDVGQYWHFDGDPLGAGEWAELQLGASEGEGATGGGMQATDTEETSTVTPGGQATGGISYQYFPGTGEEIMLLRLVVTPWAGFISVTDEEVTLVGEEYSTLSNSMARPVLVEDVVVTENVAENPVIYTQGTDYVLALEQSGDTGVARLTGSSITDGQTVLVSYSYQPGVSGFRLRLRSSESGGDILYELNTEMDPEWPRGHEVRDPNFGYLPMCYYINEDGEPLMRYEITNWDDSLSSAFRIDCKYKPLT